MSSYKISGLKVNIVKDDIPKSFAQLAHKAKRLACDIETSGLDWSKDKIGTCQVHVPNKSVIVIRIGSKKPDTLLSLLSDPYITKVFHHAMFDLRFIVHRWNIFPKNIVCTKIAAKLLDREQRGKSTLKALLDDYLGITIEKEQRLSQWVDVKLRRPQIEYAASDVIYLWPLYERLEKKLRSRSLLNLAHRCFRHIPTQVQLELLGYKNIYKY
ncbi:MAG: ribonuclease D [Planctomycetota bacterium]